MSRPADRARRFIGRLPNKHSTHLGNTPPASKSPIASDARPRHTSRGFPLGGLRTPAPVSAAPPSCGRHPQTFTITDISRWAIPKAAKSCTRAARAFKGGKGISAPEMQVPVSRSLRPCTSGAELRRAKGVLRRSQFLHECLSGTEVRCFVSFREPPVNGAKETSRLDYPALVAPKPSQTHGRTQLE